MIWARTSGLPVLQLDLLELLVTAHKEQELDQPAPAQLVCECAPVSDCQQGLPDRLSDSAQTWLQLKRDVGNKLPWRRLGEQADLEKARGGILGTQHSGSKGAHQTSCPGMPYVRSKPPAGPGKGLDPIKQQAGKGLEKVHTCQ